MFLFLAGLIIVMLSYLAYLKKAQNRLQVIQNAAARVLTKIRMSAHISPVLKSLQWLPVRFRIHFKILLLVYKTLNGLAPEYLSDMLLVYTLDP